MARWRCLFDPCDRQFDDKAELEAHIQMEHVEIEDVARPYHVEIESASEDMDDSSDESLAERVPSREVPNVSTVIELLSMPEDPLSVFGPLTSDLILHITGAQTLSEVTTLVIKDASFSQFKTNANLNLAQLVNIQELNLSDNYIQDLSGVAKLSSLRSVCLDSNQICSLAPLQALSNLQVLSAARNLLKSVRTLGTFPELREINLSHNHLINEMEVLEVLQKQPKLDSASLEGNPFMKRDRHMHYKLIGKLQLHCLDSEEVTQLDYSIALSISLSGATDQYKRRGSTSLPMTSMKAAQMKERLRDEVMHDPLFKRHIAALKQKTGGKFGETLERLMESAVRRVNLE